MENFSSGQLINNRYLLQELVGRGGFSEVWKATDEMTRETVALKIFNSNEGVDEYKQTTDFQHPHILIPKFIGYHDPNTPFLVLPFCDRGTAQALIGKISQRELATLMLHIAGALVFVHDRKTIHNDLKPDNFLISSDLDKVKYYLSDFGISDQRNRYKTHDLAAQNVKQEPRGIIPMPYRAPELTDHEGNLTDRNAVLNTDIWAFGASIHELVVGTPPFGSQGGLAQIMTLKGGKQNADNLRNTWPKDFSPDLLDLVKECLDYTPWERPDAAKIRDAAKLFLEKGVWKEKKDDPMPLPPPPLPPPPPPLPPSPPPVRTWIVLSGVLLALALIGGLLVANNKYKTLVKQGDDSLVLKDTTVALEKYTAASKMSFFANQQLTDRIDSLKQKKKLIPSDDPKDPGTDSPEVDPTEKPKENPSDPIKDRARPDTDKPSNNTDKPSTGTEVPAAPVVDLSLSANQIEEGSTVTFTDNTKLPDGFKVRGYEWDFGDGTKQRGTKPTTITHTYNKAGKYVVKLCYNAAKFCNEQAYFVEVLKVPPPPSGDSKVGIRASDRIKCPEEKFESGTFKLTISTKTSISLQGIRVIASTGGSISISLLEAGSVLKTINKKTSQNPSGTMINISALPKLDAGKSYTLQIQTLGEVRLQNLATCSPDYNHNASPHVTLEYVNDHYVIFDLEYLYY